MTGDLENRALLTDLYELTMAQSYYHEGMFSDATFSLFIRAYPEGRGYFVNSGLERVLSFLENMHFSDSDLAYLSTTGLFTEAFLQYLSSVKFTGEVYAMPEGRIFFRDEPVLEVTAPIVLGQLVETAVINRFNFAVSAASKIARCVQAAAGREVVDFSLRRTQGTDAGIEVARSGWIAGLSATSNVFAGKLYGIPVSGTMAHSYVTAFADELTAFRAYAGFYHNDTVLLIDTYDTLKGAENAITVAKQMAAQGYSLKGVRLDSGDMVSLSRSVRHMLDEAGLPDVKIFASGGFDEYRIHRCLQEGALIDGFGAGTRMGVSADAPYLDMAYKLVEYADQPLVKLSAGKQTLASPKQVFRSIRNGKLVKDTIGLRNERLSGKPLLRHVMSGGRRTGKKEGLQAARYRFQSDRQHLEDKYREIEAPASFTAETSTALDAVQSEAVRTAVERELGPAS